MHVLDTLKGSILLIGRQFRLHVMAGPGPTGAHASDIFSVPLSLNLSPKLFLTKLKNEQNMPGARMR
jgi:hypothetical protein